MDKVVHFEIPAEDIARAKKFYSIFGWNIQDIPGIDYVALWTGPVDEKRMPKEPGSINGGMMKRNGQVKAPVVTINVKSVEEALERVTRAGGKIVQGKSEVPNMGYYAYFTDTEGNVMGLWETMKK